MALAYNDENNMEAEPVVSIWVKICRDLEMVVSNSFGEFVRALRSRDSYAHVMSSYDQQIVLALIRQHGPPPYDDDEEEDCLSEEEVVSRLKTRRWSEAEEREGSCCVCLDELVGVITIATLACGHEFHLHCITPWLRTNCLCPLCRAQVLHI